MNFIKANQLLITNLLAALLFLYLPYVFAFDGFFDMPDLLHSRKDRFDLLLNSCILGYLFFNYYYLYNKLFINGNKYVYIGIQVLVCVFVFLLAHFNFHPPHHRHHHVEQHMHPPKDENFRPPRPRGLNPKETAFLCIAGIMISIFLRTQKRYNDLEKEKTSTELSYIKSQINPHFLFNTLNSIYAQSIKEDAVLTSESLLKLSSIMRYAVSEAANDSVELEKDIAFIKDYVALQKLRLDKDIDLNFSIEGSAKGLYITPMLLISFVENAFKHGVSPDEQGAIQIQIRIEGEGISLYTHNSKPLVQFKTIDSTGIGLSSTKKRLALLYPGKHNLKVEETENNYSVNLSIQLK